MEKNETFHKILFFNLDRIGDVIRSTFLFRAIKKHFPQSYLVCVTLAPSDELLRNDPYLDMVYAVPHHDIRALMHTEKTILHMCFPVFQLLDSLRLQQFDLIINPFSEFGAIASRYIKPRYMLGRVMDKEGTFAVQGEETAKFAYIMANHRGFRYAFRHNFADLYARIMHDIGITIMPEEQYPHVFATPHDEAWAHTFLTEHGYEGSSLLVGMHVGAFSHEKQWPIEHFRTIAEYLIEHVSATVLISGSTHEAQTCIAQMIKPMRHKPIVAAGVATLAQSVALIRRCSLFITNDTGPMHIAAACGIPIIALFGRKRTIPEESKPWGDGHHILIGDHIADIPVEKVLAAINKTVTLHQA